MTELSDVLQLIHKHANALEAVLIEEAGHLKEPTSVEKIETLATQKMDLVQTLDQLAVRRKQLIQVPANLDIQNQDTDWQSTLAILARCQVLNNQAGADIAVQSRYKQRALDILSNARTETPLYSASGATRTVSAGQALGKA